MNTDDNQPSAKCHYFVDEAGDPSLQAVDYMLWALQRLYERQESRYWDFVWPKVSLVYDIDDVRNHAYGEYYSQRNPLSTSEVQNRTPGI
jgi:hypothetical protein